MVKKKEINIPGADGRLKSVGIIMDGNGRWAKARGLSRNEGHKAGAKVIKEVIECLNDLDVHHVTLYAFSTENWKRPKDEVNGIMRLIYGYLEKVEEIKEEYDTSIKFIGDKSALPKILREKCIEIEKMSVGRSHIINIALNYGGRDEIVMAVNKAIKEGRTSITAEDIKKIPKKEKRGFSKPRFLCVRHYRLCSAFHSSAFAAETRLMSSLAWMDSSPPLR